ncbi:UbiA family prenyltransferase [Salinadaptatus halalkaliphilus]|uniref:UbiA family prenyltransferase n=1 Tax=Salinadaptatus halalkaliphilus TaxID=2419781 RepID=UPI003743686A
MVHSNLVISLATTSVAVTTMILAGLPLEAIPLFIVFAATMFVYTVNRFTDLDEDEQNVPRRAAFAKRYGAGWLAVGVGLYLGAIVAAVALGLPGAVYLGLPLVVALAYSYGGIKRVFLVKNCFVGGAWAGIPLGVGYYYGQLLALEILFLAGYVFAMITIAAVIFDIKDIEGDREAGVSTVPNVFGPRVTRIGSLVATATVAIAVVIVVFETALAQAFLVVLAMNGYVTAYTPFARADRGPLFYGFVVDGEHVFLAALVCLLEWGGFL